MLISRNSKILAAVALAVGLAACASKKPATGDAATEQGAAGGPGASASAGGLGGGLGSEALGGAGGANGSTAAPLSVLVFRFDYDSAEVMPQDYNALKAHAQYLRRNSNARLLVGGHTDERGTREYNMALGERRAKAVAAFLTTNGAAPNQLEVVSYGEEKPLAMGESESAWAENRRVELQYTAGRP